MMTSKTLVMLLKVTIVAIIVASVTMRSLVLETAQDDHHRGHEDGHRRGHGDDHRHGHGNKERAMKCCFLSSQSQQPFIYVYIYSYLFKLKSLFPSKTMDIFCVL